MLNNNMSTFIQPVSLTSPAGILVRPRITEFTYGDKLITEAKWICPKSGQIFKQGTVNEKSIIGENIDEQAEHEGSVVTESKEYKEEKTETSHYQF